MSFLVLSNKLTKKEYISDIPESNKQKGIQCFKFFEILLARNKKIQSEFRIVYICDTIQIAEKLEFSNSNFSILESDFEKTTSWSICSFIVKNEDINKINQNLLKDYNRLIGEEFSLFVSTLKKEVIFEDLEYLNTLNLEFKYLTEAYTYSWQGIR